MLSLDDDFGAAPASVGTVGIPADVEPKLRGWFNSVQFGAGKTTTLYEDAFVRLSLSFEYRAHQGRLVVYVNNLHSDDLSQVHFDIPSVPFMKIGTTQEVSPNINFGEQSRILLSVECMRPFTDAPEFTFSFVTKNSEHRYPLRLPVTAACFFDPVVLDKPSYMQRWKALEGKSISILTSIFPPSHYYMLQVRIEKFRKFFSRASRLRPNSWPQFEIRLALLLSWDKQPGWIRTQLTQVVPPFALVLQHPMVVV